MKYIVVLADGMSGYPLESLDNRTTMATAKKPNIDALAKNALVGLVKTVPDTMAPGSDVANLGAMGFNPEACYTGRSPLEAVSIGVKMEAEDIAFRCNFVTLSDEKEYDKKTMLDYSAQEITTQEARELIKAIDEVFKTDNIKFYPGISYRHCMLWHGGAKGLGLIPPHDISDKVVGGFLPKEPLILEMMEKSYNILKDHPINKDRVKRGLNPANSIWLWGEGTKPNVPNFYENFGIKGGVISAVDLIKGIGISAGLKVIDVEGATGNIHTNFHNKCQAAYEVLKDKDYVYIHIEAPDECGHRGEIDNKIKAIEFIDEKIVGPLTEKLLNDGQDFAILIMPDHPTPIATKTHGRDPVPFLLYKTTEKLGGVETFNEATAKGTKVFFNSGADLVKEFIK